MTKLELLETIRLSKEFPGQIHIVLAWDSGGITRKIAEKPLLQNVSRTTAINGCDVECIRIGCIFQNAAVESQRVPGAATVRIFAVDQVSLLNHELENRIIAACDSVTIEEQQAHALTSPKGKCSSLALIPLPDVIKSLSKETAEGAEEPETLRGQPLADNVESIVRHLLT